MVILARWKKGMCAVAVLLAMLAAFNLPVIFAYGEQGDKPILTVTGETLPEKALTGTQITIPTATAVKADKVTPLEVSVRVSCEAKDITHSEKTYTLSQKGMYNVYFEVLDPISGLYDFKSYNIDVRDVWLSIKLDEVNPDTAFVGLPIKLKAASVFGFDDTKVDATVAVSAKKGNITTPLSSLTFTPPEAGKYTITYTAEKSGESVSVQSYITVSGTRPTLTVRNIPTFINVGDKVTLPKAEAFNLDGGVVTAVDVTVSVTKDNEVITVADYVFTATKAGTYTVVYTAVNSDGIPSYYTATITCKKAGCKKALMISGITIGSVIIAGGVAVLLIFMIRRRRKSSNQLVQADDAVKDIEGLKQTQLTEQTDLIIGESDDEGKK